MKKKKWIQEALNPKRKGALRKELGIKEGKTIPLSTLKKAERSKNPKTRKRAILAETLRKIRKK